MLVRAGSGAARWSSLALIALAEPRLLQLELVDILVATRKPGGRQQFECEALWSALGCA